MNLVRVTEIVGLLTDLSMIPKDVLYNAIQRGNYVHATCAEIARGGFVIWDERYEGYIKSFQKWFALVEKVIAIEPELTDKRYGIIGHPDFIVQMRDFLSPRIIDIKTPITASKTWRIQLAGYKLLALKAGYNIRGTGILQLDPKGGTPKVTWYDNDRQDIQAFFSLLNIKRWLKGESV